MAGADYSKEHPIALSLTPMREKATFCAKALNVAPWSTTESVLVHVLAEWKQNLAKLLTHQISYYSEEHQAR
jgi:hypothetical protein